MSNKNLNRKKVMLDERYQTNMQLAEQLGRKTCYGIEVVTNASQPSLEMVFKITETLKCNYTDLIRDVEEQASIVGDKLKILV